MTKTTISANRARSLIDLGDDLIATVVYTGVGNKRKEESGLQRRSHAEVNPGIILKDLRHLVRSPRLRLSLASETARIESGLFRSDRPLLTILSSTATPIPRAYAKATKYQRVGNPRTKISAL